MKIFYYLTTNSSTKLYSVGLSLQLDNSRQYDNLSWWQGDEYDYKPYNWIPDLNFYEMPKEVLMKRVGLKMSLMMNLAALNIAKEKDNIV